MTGREKDEKFVRRVDVFSFISPFYSACSRPSMISSALLDYIIEAILGLACFFSVPRFRNQIFSCEAEGRW